MTLEEERGLIETWRGRRFLACRLIGTLTDLIEGLGINSAAADPLPNERDGMYPIHPGLKLEMQNMAANLLRMILVANDGHVSGSRLQRF